MRVACVLVTHLRAKVELRNYPNLKETTAVIVDRSKGKPLVVDTFPAVVGVSLGMTQEQALSRQPGTIWKPTSRRTRRCSTVCSPLSRASATGWRDRS